MKFLDLIKRLRLPRRSPAVPEPAGVKRSLPERLASRVPAAYFALTLLLAGLACLYIFMFPVLAMLFMGRAMFHAANWDWLPMAQYICFSVICVVFSFTPARVRPRLPNLYRLEQKRARKLFQMIGHMRSRLGAPAIGQVFVDDSVDVRLIKLPVNGFPVRFRYSLTVGLPALLLLSPLQFKALLIRRLGEATMRRHRVVSWLAAMRDFGDHMLAACPNWRRAENIMMRAWFVWYSPLYRRWSKPLQRRHEIHLDGYAMESVSDHDVAELFGSQIVATRYLREVYLPEVLRLSRKRPMPPPIFFTGLERRFNRYWNDTQAKRWLREAWSDVEGIDDLTPALAPRLIEIGHHTVRLPAQLKQSAAQLLLGAEVRNIGGALDRAWKRAITPSWLALHQDARREQQKMQILLAKSRKQQLGTTEARELARLIERCQGKDQAVPFYKQMLVNNPNDATAAFIAGRFLLTVNDRQGLGALTRAVKLDSRFNEPATNLIAAFERRTRAETDPVEVTKTGTQILIRDHMLPAS